MTSGRDGVPRKRVLVVDDESDFLVTYERLLRRQGYEVITASTRAAALAAVAAGELQLVISDVRLPDGDGLDVVRAARAASIALPVIVVTGYPSDETRRAATAAGATTFLAKPFAADSLVAAVRASLGDGA